MIVILILGVKVNRKFQYKETVEMDDSILLDFDVNDVPTSLEILDVSKRFNLPKNSLKSCVLKLIFPLMKIIFQLMQQGVFWLIIFKMKKYSNHLQAIMDIFQVIKLN